MKLKRDWENTRIIDNKDYIDNLFLAFGCGAIFIALLFWVFYSISPVIHLNTAQFDSFGKELCKEKFNGEFIEWKDNELRCNKIMEKSKINIITVGLCFNKDTKFESIINNIGNEPQRIIFKKDINQLCFYPESSFVKENIIETWSIEENEN